MHISIYSLKKTFFDGEAMSINCQTEAGEITVLDKHAPLIAVLKSGIIRITDKDKKEHFFREKSGFLEVGTKNTGKFIIDEE